MNNQDLFALLKSINASRELVMKSIRKIDWQHLAANDLKVEATVQYARQHKVGLLVAKEAVESFISNI